MRLPRRETRTSRLSLHKILPRLDTASRVAHVQFQKGIVQTVGVVNVLYLALVCGTFAVEAHGHALSQHDDRERLFRSGVDLVALNVVVTDADGRFITGLTADEFLVLENGGQQEIAFFSDGPLPLDLAILLDTSASMTGKLDTVQEAAIGFASSLRPGDRLTVVDIKKGVKVLHALDEDLAGAVAAIRQTTPSGRTALYNGLYLSLREMIRLRRGTGELRRQAIAVLSDGNDTASLLTFDDVMDIARGAGIAMYTITPRSAFAARQAANARVPYSSPAEDAMTALARETGGRAFFPVDVSELAGIYSSIAEELSRQYALGYTSTNPSRDGAFRRISVRVRERPGVRVRTRSGYVADGPTTSPLTQAFPY